MTELEKVTAQRDFLLLAINTEISNIKSTASMFDIAYACATLEQSVKKVTKDIQNAR